MTPLRSRTKARESVSSRLPPAEVMMLALLLTASTSLTYRPLPGTPLIRTWPTVDKPAEIAKPEQSCGTGQCSDCRCSDRRPAARSRAGAVSMMQMASLTYEPLPCVALIHTWPTDKPDEAAKEEHSCGATGPCSNCAACPRRAAAQRAGAASMLQAVGLAYRPLPGTTMIRTWPTQ